MNKKKMFKIKVIKKIINNNYEIILRKKNKLKHKIL